MQPFRRVFSIATVCLVLGMLAGLAQSAVTAATKSDSPLPTPVVPEPYPNTDIYPALVYLAKEADLQSLYSLQIDFEGIKPIAGTRPIPANFEPALATVYINPDQSGSLTQAGLTPIPIPNEGYRSFLAYGPGSGAPNAWPTFTQYVARMQGMEVDYPDIIDLVQIGSSVQGKGLWCMKVSDKPGLEEFEPEFKYTANHHGDETTGIEMIMRLAEYLVENYGEDPLITDMVDKMEIWLCPIYNPDGYMLGQRENANGIDLNRNYPDRFMGNPPNLQPETLAFMNFENNHRFVMGANFHGGALVLNYPWDAITAPPKLLESDYAPDDALFIDFGIGYTSRNPDIWNGGFPQGITRGWEWYQIWGSMQDWDYFYNGEHHVTLEISDLKMPDYGSMDDYWNKNREAMLWWMQRAWTGLAGNVLDARNNAPLDATVTLVGREVPNSVRTDPEVGDYHRVVSAGLYTLTASAAGYQDQSMDVWAYDDSVNGFDFTLCPSDTLVVSGTVSDASSGLPLPAYIDFIGSRQVTHTDPETGKYSISICPYSYTMRVSADWHYPVERAVSIFDDQIQDFTLQPTPNLSLSNKQSSTIQVLPGDLVHYQLHAINIGPTSPVVVTDTLPAELTWTGELTATHGIPVFANAHILWQGEISSGEPVTISYTANLNPCLTAGTAPLNNAEFSDGVNGIITGKVVLEVQNAPPSQPTSPGPSDEAEDLPITARLSWEPGSDLNCDPLTYDIAFGTTLTPPVIASGLTVPSFTPGVLQLGTTYYWQVIVHDGWTVTAGPVWSFTTQASLPKVFLPFSIK